MKLKNARCPQITWYEPSICCLLFFEGQQRGHPSSITQIRVFSLIPVMFRAQLGTINYSIGIRKNAKKIKSGTAKFLGVRLRQWRK